jgi:UDP-2-acetamido-2,6-beta-L-arabino-hexul-4-ose reductase
VRVLVTGSDGFIGKNLLSHLALRSTVTVLPVTRATSPSELTRAAAEADFVFHLAAVNRPPDPKGYAPGNIGPARALCDALAAARNKAPVVLASSLQVETQSPYGASKLAAEQVFVEQRGALGAPLAIFRLPNVFGKWSRPNYNSVVATFCHNIARDLPIDIHDPNKSVPLVYVDDVVAAFLACMDRDFPDGRFAEVEPVYRATLLELAELIRGFRSCRDTLSIGPVGSGFTRALYSTYVSFLPTQRFVYDLKKHEDARGRFVEFLKSTSGGQLSFFTARPGVTRGGHYHHSKTEKFLVVSGRALFKFRNLVTDERFEVRTSGESPQVVETVPGWAHDITNVGDTELTVMLWANEVFDRARPDTYESRL